MIPTIWTIAKKEIMDNIRNRWIIVMSIAFAIMALFSSYFGSMGKGWQDFENTMILMIFFLQFLIPVIGLMLGYASIGREVETGTMNALISFPVTRLEIILGKFLGLGIVLSTSIFIGFTVAGFIIGLNVSNPDYEMYFIFILESVLLGLVFLSIAMFFSSILKKRSSAMGASIFTWFFFSMIWGMLMFGLMWATDISIQDAEGFFALNMFSPVASYTALISLEVGGFPTASLSAAYDHFPPFYNGIVLVTTLLTWIIVMIFLSYWTFKSRDI